MYLARLGWSLTTRYTLVCFGPNISWTFLSITSLKLFPWKARIEQISSEFPNFSEANTCATLKYFRPVMAQVAHVRLFQGHGAPLLPLPLLGYRIYHLLAPSIGFPYTNAYNGRTNVHERAANFHEDWWTPNKNLCKSYVVNFSHDDRRAIDEWIVHQLGILWRILREILVYWRIKGY